MYILVTLRPYSYAVSAFFTNAVLATLVAIIVYGILFLPFFIIIGVTDDLPLWGEVLVVSCTCRAKCPL